MSKDTEQLINKIHSTPNREYLGSIVREEWVLWASKQPTPKESWLVPWEELSEPDKEVDRRIGERLWRLGHNDRNRNYEKEIETLRIKVGLLRAAAVLRKKAEHIQGENNTVTLAAVDAWLEAADDLEALAAEQPLAEHPALTELRTLLEWIADEGPHLEEVEDLIMDRINKLGKGE